MKLRKRPRILILAIGICLLPLPATAGGNGMLLESPAPVHKFLDGKNLGLQSINILIMAADIAATKRAVQVPGAREMNPLVGNQGAMIALKIAGVGAGFGMAYMMHKSGHHKLERAIPLIFGAPSAVAALHNSGIHR